ncbi:MAG: hypothetical protein ACI30W_04250 [Muribaculaceae bacterium]
MLTAIIFIFFVYAMVFYIIPWLTRQLMAMAGRRMMRKFARSMGLDDDAFSASGRGDKSRRAARDSKSKKFGSADGEYVAFEVIENDADDTYSSDRDASAAGNASYSESRIVDVEWEELPAEDA